MTGKISSFKGKYEFLSNFYPAIVKLNGIPYPTVEHAFQAAKTVDPMESHWVGLAQSPGEAKKRGRKITLREDWEEAKLGVMLDLLRQKYDAHLSFEGSVLGEAWNTVHIPFVALDPKGDWWGVKSSPHAKTPAIPPIIFRAVHPDPPLHE